MLSSVDERREQQEDQGLWSLTCGLVFLYMGSLTFPFLKKWTLGF